MNKKHFIYPLITIIVASAALYINNTYNSPTNTSKNATDLITTTTPASTIDTKITKQAPSTTVKQNDSLLNSFASMTAPSSDWTDVDMQAIQDELPNNLYWELAAPSDDESVVEKREQLKAHWNTEYGKVLSGTANQQEIEAYYHRQQQVSADYVEFSDYLLQHHGKQLPERDLQLLKLTSTMHRGRHDELEQEFAQAVERSKKHSATRERWLQDKDAFEAELEAQAQAAR